MILCSIRIQRFKLRLLVGVFVLISLSIITYRKDTIPRKNRSSSVFWNETRYERYCRQKNDWIYVGNSSNSTKELIPGRDLIPYSYSQWRSNALMPRLLTQCEHAIYMDLLTLLVERVFKKYNIQYMIMAATLLGSYTRHDILPWDDDVDICISVSERSYFKAVVASELSQEPYSVMTLQLKNKRNYDKIYFSWSPRAGKTRWNFPFIDVFYHDQNSSHTWLVSKPKSCPVRLADVFPLVLRPLGPLWLYGPREPMAQFESRRMRRIENGCLSFPYSHKHERFVRKHTLDVSCSLLKSDYPYVKRRCTLDYCTEKLILGDSHVIQTLTYDYTYRTFLYADVNRFYRAC